jgi:ADP-heptose:LPS heptosyltransferase
MHRSVAIVKPDHIGDLILAAPAILQISAQQRCVSLFVAEENLLLARFLFPWTESRPIALGYLEKHRSNTGLSVADALAVVRDFDITVFLRSDHILNRARIGHVVRRAIFAGSDHRSHDSVNHRLAIRAFFGDYVTDEAWTRQNRQFPKRLTRVGLCIGSGFPANKWSIIKWAKLSDFLRSAGIALAVIGGVRERIELEILADAAGLDRRDIIVGDADFDIFLKRVGDLDLVVASDGGSGHLCSLATSVLTIAGSVPFRQFAPFGSGNRVVSLDLPCSPCLNAHHTLINGCFSYECSYGIEVEDVIDALHAPDLPPGSMTVLNKGAKLFYAPSHGDFR